MGVVPSSCSPPSTPKETICIQISNSKIRPRSKFPIFCFEVVAKFLGCVGLTINLDIQNGSPGIYLIALPQSFELSWNQTPKTSASFFSSPMKSKLYPSITAIPVVVNLTALVYLLVSSMQLFTGKHAYHACLVGLMTE